MGKRKYLSILQKYDVLHDLEAKKKTRCDIAKEYNIAESTICIT
jgi:hypothetical protein